MILILILSLPFLVISSVIATQADAKRYLKKHGNLDGFWWIKNK